MNMIIMNRVRLSGVWCSSGEPGRLFFPAGPGLRGCQKVQRGLLTGPRGSPPFQPLPPATAELYPYQPLESSRAGIARRYFPAHLPSRPKMRVDAISAVKYEWA